MQSAKSPRFALRRKDIDSCDHTQLLICVKIGLLATLGGQEVVFIGLVTFDCVPAQVPKARLLRDGPG